MGILFEKNLCRIDRKKKETKMNVLYLMMTIILIYWIIAMFIVSRVKDWD